MFPISLVKKLKTIKTIIVKFLHEIIADANGDPIVSTNTTMLKDIIERNQQKAKKVLNSIAVKVVGYHNLISGIKDDLHALEFVLLEDLSAAYDYINKGDPHYALKRIVDFIESGDIERIIIVNKAIIADAKGNPKISVDTIAAMEDILERQISIAKTFKADKEKLRAVLESSEKALKGFINNTI